MLFSPLCPGAGASGWAVRSLREHDEGLRLVHSTASAHLAWVAALAGPLVALLPVRSIGAATAPADSQERRVGPRVALPPGSGRQPGVRGVRDRQGCARYARRPAGRP